LLTQINERTQAMHFEFPIYKGLSQRDRYIQEIVWMCHNHYWPPVPSMVWHYTSVEVLTKILTTNSLLFTHVSKMNDPNELAASINSLEMILRSRLDTPNLSVRKRVMFSKALGQIDYDSDQSPFFVFSTSAAEDNAGQWNRYGDKSKGVCLGFDPKGLLAFLGKPPFDHPLLAPIIYDSAKTTKFFSLLAVMAENNFDSDFSQVADDARAAELFLEELGQHINFLSVCTKLSGWADEREWRFAKSKFVNTFQPDDILTLNGENKPRWRVRAHEVDGIARQLPISSVTIGPEATVTVDELKYKLSKAGLAGVDVRRSLLTRIKK
jgi:Protein of unknown function (DUF2971)